MDSRIPEITFWTPQTPEQIVQDEAQYGNTKMTPLTQMPVLAFSLRAILNATAADPALQRQLANEFLLPLVRYWRWWRGGVNPFCLPPM